MHAIETTMTRPNGEPVRLRTKADADGVMSGAMQAFDASNRRIELIGAERWWAVAALHRAIEGRRMGA